MENNIQLSQSGDQTVASSKSFIANVFSWMFFALTLSAVMAYLFSHSISLMQLLVTETGLSIFGYIVMFAPIGFVLLMSFAFNKLSYPALLAFFIAYAATTGISLSFIFLAYDLGTIYITFGVTALTFAIMAVMGYTTKTDLTSFGKLMFMGLIGIVIASLINFFVGSEKMDYIISIIGVIVFTGLTAYDVQKLKRIGAGVEYGTAIASKLSVMGALTLYLDFINLFLMLLRLFGGKRD